jgi:hypothetical protein
MRPILTERIFESSLDCTYKCHLLLNGRQAMFHLTFPTTITRFSMVKEIGHASHSVGSRD